MAVTETSLLTSFLLPPAPLAVSLSLQQFTELLPKSRRDDVVIPALYRELQKQRAQDVERVKQNIAAEAKLGQSQQRHIRRIRQARLRQQGGDDTDELTMEAKLFPENADEQQREAHTINTVLPEIEQAELDLRAELGDMEREAESMRKELQATIGDLSDLRYGRFTKTPGATGGDLATEVVESLQRIQQLVND